MGANGQIGVGVIGLGDGGMSNIRALRRIEGVRIAAICDLKDARIGSCVEEIGRPPDVIAYWEHSSSLVRDPNVELVVVATPDDQHLAPARAALEAGKYVFVEKPVAATLEDLAAFKDLVRQHPGKLLFGEKYSGARPVEAALEHREALGEFLWGSTLYTMWDCGRIMGGGKRRTEMAYNPCVGGLSHNFMTALLFTGAPIKRVRATGTILTYHENLERHGGFDTMEGTLEFTNGRRLSWVICLAIEELDSPFGHRTIAHTFQFEHGALVYGPDPEGDRLFVKGQRALFTPEPSVSDWPGYNIKGLYAKMHQNLIAAIRGEAKPRHTIEQGINVAAACALAFESAKQDGRWLEVPF